MSEKKRATYAGPLPGMKGRKATVTTFGPEATRCLATFDIDPEKGDDAQGYGYGTHDFAVAHFDFEEAADHG